MPIDGIEQPDILPITPSLRLRRFDGQFLFALPWYQDAETQMLVNGKSAPYDEELLERMYTYLDASGELYFIEVSVGGSFRPIGDVTFRRDDMPIVIGEPAWRGRGIGRRVVQTLILRAKALGFQTLRVAEIYSFNIGSRRLFESCGFQVYEKTGHGDRYILSLTDMDA